MVGKQSTRPDPEPAAEQSGRQAEARPTKSAPAFKSKFLRLLPSIILPIFTAVVQHVIWPLIHPSAWSLFYPAVVFSSWIGGLTSGIVATLLSSVIVWWRFLPPEYTFAKDAARYIISAAVFLFVGLFLSFFQERLQRTTKQIAGALDEAREAGRKLRRAHDDITSLIEQASDGIFIADASDRLIEVNAAGCVVLGYAREERDELVGQPVTTLVGPADVERLWQTKRHLQEGRSHLEEWNLRRKDGTELPAEVSAKILPDSRWQIFVRDITERKAAERKLLQVSRANHALSQCNQALIRAVDEPSFLQEVCDIIVQDTGYPFCWVGRAEYDDAKSVTAIAEAGRDSDYLSTVHIRWADTEEGRGPTGTCIRTGQTVAVRNIATDPTMTPWRREALRHGYSSILAVPLFVQSEVFGSISIYSAETDAFSADETQLLTELASDLAFGIATLRTEAQRRRAEKELVALNAELEERVTARTAELAQAHEREFAIGSRIQQTLLLDYPPMHLPGIRIAALALPTQRIDGDFIVFMEPQERSFDVIVGDVMGKGIPAALLGAATKAHLLKALGYLSAFSSSDQLPKPEDIVMLAHADIVHQLIELDSFVTLCYARIDPQNSVVELVDCGHTGMIQLHGRTGRAELLRGDNLPLGVREDERYEQKAFPIEAGDSLFLFSDGITEARNADGELFGLERLQQCITAHRWLEPEPLVETIRQALIAHCGSDHFADDVTIVAVRVEEVGPPMLHTETTIKSDLRQLHEVREFIRSFCSKLPGRLLGQDSVCSLELAVNEAASNIMKHAYRGRADQPIYIEAEAFQSYVAVRLHHHGHGFTPAPLSPPSFDPPRESGFGLYMLSKCVDEVHYYQDSRGMNCISLTKLSRKRPANESETPWRFEQKSN
jgi:sigma-B regulation protein RsbU (phosphoserine phosphatase)